MAQPARDTVALAVVESSQVGEARRLAQELARSVGLDAVGQGKVALIVTELGNNLIRHAEGGELIVRAIRPGPRARAGFEVLAVDRGPGRADFQRCLADGYSTAGTPGNGLGAVARLCDEFDALSAPGAGTVIAARYLAPTRDAADGGGPAPDLALAAVCLPMAGEVECGDAWAYAESPSGLRSILVVDGLGHGPKAAEAAEAAVATFRRSPSFGPSEHLGAIHPALRATRGAAVAIAAIDPNRRELRYAGVGNIAGTIIGGDGARRGLVSHSGTVGLVLPRNQEFTHPWPAGALLIMHSDGLVNSWRLDTLPALRARTPSVIAGVLYRDFSRRRDDVTVVVARDGGRAG